MSEEADADPARIEAAWLTDPSVRAVTEALAGQAVFVGGCVRNALLGEGPSDLDLATPLVPADVVAALEAAGLKAVPTGIEHGTVTAIARGTAIEITTFRADIETDGRHATVRFTTDIAEDAARRDFTMNALYADTKGLVIDPLGGVPDLRAGRVRFIGSAVARIVEDHLRILRFYRFTAWYSRTGVDGQGHAACAARASAMGGLARERVGQEMRKLLAAPSPGEAVAAMAEAGVLSMAVPGADAGGLLRLLYLETRIGRKARWIGRLAALGGEDPSGALRLSKAETRALSDTCRIAGGVAGPAAAAEEAGAEVALDALMLRAAKTDAPLPHDLESEIARGTEAEMPLGSADLIADGLVPGPALGQALGAARAAWRDSGLRLDGPALRKIALAAAGRG